MSGTTLDGTTVGESPTTVSLRQIAAVVAGNALEFYDFLCFSFFSLQIAHTFFPGQDEDLKLLSSLAVFGVGFLTRPLGAYVIGRWGDRVGRKPAMMLSFTLMGVAITGLALTPSFATIGWAAPILFLCFRLLQGFALGGEVGPTTAFLLEAAPRLQRGFYVSLQFATQDLSILFAGIVGEVLSNLLSTHQLDTFGWRIAFLIGAAVIPFGLMIRRGLPETLHPNSAGPSRAPGQNPLWRLAILGMIMLATVTITNYVIDYTTTFAENTLHISAALSFGATVTIGLSGVCCAVLSGLISDRVGRRPVMIGGGIIYLLCVFPVYFAVIHFKSAAALLLGPGLLAGLQEFYAGPILTGVTEGLPRHIRSGALALIYAIAISSFGGTTQFIVKGLIKLTGSSYAPAGFMTAALLVGLTAMLFVRETAPVKLDRNPS